jgi:hypothetical protein
MSDQCRNCTAFEDVVACRQLPCGLRENWSYRALERELAEATAKERARCVRVVEEEPSWLEPQNTIYHRPAKGEDIKRNIINRIKTGLLWQAVCPAPVAGGG